MRHSEKIDRTSRTPNAISLAPVTALVAILLVGCSNPTFSGPDDSAKLATPGGTEHVDLGDPDPAPEDSLATDPNSDPQLGDSSDGNIVDTTFPQPPEQTVGDGSSGYPSSPPTTTPPSPGQQLEIKKVRCDLLVDKNGIFTNIRGNNYLAITGITECAFNEINEISGPCDPDKEVTILRPEEIEDIENDDLKLPTNRVVEILPADDPRIFLCLSYEGKVVASIRGIKVIIGMPELVGSN